MTHPLLFRSSALAVFAALQVVLATNANAVAENWQVGRLAGRAWIDRIDGERADLALGAEVQPGVTIYTADRSTVTLLRGPEVMVIGPKSIVAISEHPTQGLTTTVLERAGSVDFDVDRQNVRHFSVETPMLAAVVKGTRFKVSVDRRTGGVSVSRGTVEVMSLRSGQATDVTAGQNARIASGGNLSVGGAGRPAPIVQGGPRAPVVTSVGDVATTGAVATDFTAAELAAVATVVTPQVTVGEVTSPAVATSAVTTSTTATVHNSVITPTATVTSSSPLASLQASIAKALAPGASSPTSAAATGLAPGPTGLLSGRMPGQFDGHGRAIGWGFGLGQGWGPNGFGYTGSAHQPPSLGPGNPMNGGIHAPSANNLSGHGSPSFSHGNPGSSFGGHGPGGGNGSSGNPHGSIGNGHQASRGSGYRGHGG